MCGIGGFVGRVAAEDAARVEAISAAQAHRGPDGRGCWSSAPASNGFGAVLGHLRLSIIDLRTTADQPMVDPETGSTLVFNGEIYNFRELRGELEGLGHRFRTNGDSEAILIGYRQWGDGVVARLRGMFAFAIADVAAGRVLLARDGYGIKPLYWCAVRDGEGRPRGIAFASETRSLVASGYASRRTCPARLRRYLWNGFVTGPETLWTDIAELPRGSYTVLDEARLSPDPVRYWRPGHGAAGSATDPEAALRDAVDCHLIADVPKVVFLSGGVDSTAIARLAHAVDPDTRTLSIGFGEAAADETRFAEEAAQAIGTTHRTRRVTSAEMLADLDVAIAALDQPSFDGTNVWYVSREAARMGFKVALAGTGGDELLGGYSSFRRLPELARLLPLLPRGAAKLLTGAACAIAPARARRFKLDLLAASGGRIEALYQSQYAMLDGKRAGDLMPDAAPEPWGLSGQRLDELADLVRGQTPLRAVTMLESELFLGDRLLREADAMSMAHSIELRVPLVDTVLSDAFDRIGDEARYHPIGTKPALRSVAAEATGAAFFQRRKQGFELPMDSWLRGALRESTERQPLDAGTCRQLGLSAAGVERLWRSFLDRPGSVYWTRIWMLFVLMRWGRLNGLTVG